MGTHHDCCHDPSSQIDYTYSYPHHIYISVQDSSIIFKLPIWRLCRVICLISTNPGLEATKLPKNQVSFFLGSGSRWLGIYTCDIDWYILPSGGHYFLTSSPFASQWEKSTGLSFENDACSFALNAMATASKCLIFRGNVLQPVIWAIRGGCLAVWPPM